MTQHGGSIIGERLAKRGVTHLFTLCGGHISPILTGAKDHGIDIVDVRDEATAAFAADAMARMTGIPGVCAVTAGPGVTNTVTAVKNAQMAESPMLILGGATATVLKGRGSLQDIDQLSIMKPITKWATTVKHVNSLGPIIDHALDVAMEGTPGPVFVEVPVDLLYPEAIVRDWYIKENGLENATGLGQRALKLYLETHLAKQFKAPHIPIEALPRLRLPAANGVNDAISDAAKALAKAERPALVVGNQAVAGMTESEARTLAASIEALGIPVWLGGSARGLLGRFSDIQFRHKRSAALKKADVVVVAGFPFDFRLGYGRKINRKGTLISVNLNAVDIKKNRKPEIGIQMHPGQFIIELARQAQPRPDVWRGWFDDIRGNEDARESDIAAQGEGTQPRVNPITLFQHIEEKMADDAVIIVDGGDFAATGAYILRPRGPLRWLDPGVFGTLGVGGGFAMAAALARPESEIWLIYGDGSSAYSLAEFDTYKRKGLAPIAVIGTDASWQQIARDQVEILGTPLGTELLRTDYHTVAEGYGGVGLLLTDEADIPEVVAEAKRLAAKGQAVCINVHLASSDFRKGSLSM